MDRWTHFSFIMTYADWLINKAKNVENICYEPVCTESNSKVLECQMTKVDTQVHVVCFIQQLESVYNNLYNNEESCCLSSELVHFREWPSLCAHGMINFCAQSCLHSGLVHWSTINLLRLPCTLHRKNHHAQANPGGFVSCFFH